MMPAKEGLNRFADVTAEVGFVRQGRSPSGLDRRLVPIDAHHRRQSFGQGVPKKTGTAIGVHQDFSNDTVANKIKECPGNGIVGLGERARYSRTAQGPMLPLGQAGGPKLFQRVIDGRNRDCAMFNIHHRPAVFCEKPDLALAGVNGDPVSKCIRVGRSEGGQHFDIRQVADPFQKLDHLAAF